MDTTIGKNKKFSILYILWTSAIVFFCVWPMGLCPIWNGEIVYHRGQYELMAESLLNGHLYLDQEVSDSLKAMENPYDLDARREQNVSYLWDHAYYDGHYYMYFGVVPVILVFLPFRILTGTALTTYRATQIFTALIVIGYFLFFHFLRDKFFPKMSTFILAAVSTAFSFASVWYFAEAPALYCTAIASAVCLILWCLYFWFRAVFDDISTGKQILLAMLGSLSGALSFGCRPTVALGSVLLIPLLAVMIRRNAFTRSDIRKPVLMLSPFLVIGVLLMLYNYLRFDDPFEFGQAYQLTFYDQHDLSPFSNFDIKAILKGFYKMFFEFNGFSRKLPFLKFAGIFIEFPIFLIGTGILIFSKPTRALLRDKDLLQISFTLLFIQFFITAFEVIMSPILLERYQSDIVPFAAVMTFIVMGQFLSLSDGKNRKRINCLLFVFSVITVLTAVLLFLIPNDMNYTEYYPEFLENIRIKLYYVKKFLLNLIF